ncbi:NUDIX domain-containing protein [Lentzea sp. BCCO 10_0798]|uniref:NUDIX domain-containing protein n=1 Tax=Lentzea kristufekii TaxID=3095430 RepID=A0ABU4U5D7_9PSEU|nr:NUDIX domain-containing protein [Lentzea sp. BCCO 10_0798]MDX8055216.1 NUDIX domain-containing protein [Lentzea sp. BCCO 10_0798]
MYTPSDFPPFAVTVDLVVLTVRADALCALLVRRGEAPFRGRWALPGGFVQVAESVDAAAARELVEETGVSGLFLEQLATYGEPRRDPRMRVVSVAYLALAPDLPVPVAGSDAASAAWVPVSEVSSLAFDHSRILADGVERARAKLEYTGLGTEFCGVEFTVAELRRVYEIVWGVGLDPRNFHRKVTGVEGFLVPTGGSTSRDGGRPAALYRRGDVGVLSPPLVRSSA